jgi:ribose/xylose/arabinose/galactoside ABC-type transport system permease subunit
MLRVLGVQDYWSTFAAGFLLVVALIIDYISSERRRKALLSGKDAAEAASAA